MSKHNDDSVVYERWVRKAIDDSVKQIYGAEKHILNSDEITLKDYCTKIPLPKKKIEKFTELQLHLEAVQISLYQWVILEKDMFRFLMKNQQILF